MARVLEGRNRASAQEAASFVDEYDRLEQKLEAELDEIDAEFKRKKRAAKKKIVTDQKAILADAKKVGVDKGIIRALADGMKKTRKAQETIEKAKERSEKLIENLDEDKKAFAVDIRTALGGLADTPLGAAAVEREEGKPDPTTAAIIDVASKEWPDAAAANEMPAE